MIEYIIYAEDIFGRDQGLGLTIGTTNMLLFILYFITIPRWFVFLFSDLMNVFQIASNCPLAM